MIMLAVVAAVFGAGAVVTLIGSWLMPRGRFIDIDGQHQHGRAVILFQGRPA
jgi:hypothetical protein